MRDFSVWAPTARQVQLQLAGELLDLAPDTEMAPDADAGGWWRLPVPGTGHGTDYAFRVDGGPPLPDPRSAWQPYGVHGASRVFDPGLHRWRDDGWGGVDALGAVFYELHVGTFTEKGTLDSAVERLDHLVALGVDIVELLPVAASPGDRGWGYDGVHLYAVQDSYGGPAALQRFVDACHARGLGVCLDIVYNHLGPEGNYLSRFGPYFTGRHDTPWGLAVNLDDEGSPQVRRWILDNAARWFTDFHVDCLRLDAVHALVDTSAWHLLAALSDEVAALASRLGRRLSLVAESDLNDPHSIEPTARGGWGMTAQWDDDVHHALHAWLTGERQGYYADFGSEEVLARVFTQAFRHAGDFSAFRGKPWGHPVDPARHRGHRFVTALQTHDQVGNRATGDRLSALVPPGRLAIGAALLLLGPYSVLLFMGEEWGAGTPWQFFTSYPDPELAAAVRRGRRAEFARHGWGREVPDPQDQATRDRSVLNWSEPTRGEHARLLAWYRDLIALRRAEPDVLDDDLRRVGVAHGDGWFALRRGRVHVLANLGPARALLPAPADAARLLSWGSAEGHADGGWLVGADSVVVLRCEA